MHNLDAIQKQRDPYELPCFIEGLPFEEYLAMDAASSGALCKILNHSPRHVKEGMDKATPAKGLGTLVHSLVLEPDKTNEIAVKPAGADKASNAGKEQLVKWLSSVTGEEPPNVSGISAQGKRLSAQIDVLQPILDESSLLVTTQADYDTAQRMRDNVLDKNVGQVIFSAGRPEVTMLAIDPTTGVMCKSRADWLPEGHDLIVDLKTSVSASYDDFAKSAGKYGYHIQAALYREIYSLVTGSSRPSFLHVVIENEPPYDCAFYEMDAEALKFGWHKAQRALEIWRKCEDADKWPGIGYNWIDGEYSINKLSLPKWAL